MSKNSWVQAVLARKRHLDFGLLNKSCNYGYSLLPHQVNSPIARLHSSYHDHGRLSLLGLLSNPGLKCGKESVSSLYNYSKGVQGTRGFCGLVDSSLNNDVNCNSEEKPNVDCKGTNVKNVKAKSVKVKKATQLDFTQVDINQLPTVIIIGRPNVGKSALFNRLIRRREALVYNTPDDHVTRDIREGIAKLGGLRFKVLDSAGLETEATSGSILSRTTGMTANVLARTNFVIFMIDARSGLHPLDAEVGKWLRKNAPGVNPIIVMNKCESLHDGTGSITEAFSEALRLGFGEPIPMSCETGLGMTELHEALQPLLEDYIIPILNESHEMENNDSEGCSTSEVDDKKLPLQLAILGRPNVGKSTLLNSLLQEERVLVGPEAGLTRDSVRATFEYEGRTIHLVDTAGWLHRADKEKSAASLSIMQSRKNLMRAHVVTLVLDAEEIANSRRSMTHAEVVIARRAVEEGRALVVIVNKMDLLRGKHGSYEKVMEAVPLEIQTVIPQVTGIPVVFTSALQGRGREAVMQQVMDTYEKWCSRLSTARLNRWLLKVMSRHSWKDQAAQPKVKYFTQVKARPPTFVAFMSGKTRLSDTDIRFLTRSLKEDFDIGGIPIRIMQRSVTRKNDDRSSINKSSPAPARIVQKAVVNDKRSLVKEPVS